MGRQPLSKYLPTRYPSPGMVLEHDELDADDPAVNPDGRSERLGGSFINIQLNDAQILALAGAPVQLVAAPGAGRAVIVRAAYFFLTVVDGAYDDVAADGNLGLIYAGGGDGSAGMIFEADAFMDAAIGTAARFISAGEDMVTPVALEVTPLENTAIMLDNDGAEFTSVANDTAANTLSVRVYYDIVDFAAFT